VVNETEATPLPGRLPVTVLPANYVNLVPLTNMSMRAGGNNPGRTYRYYTGPVRPAAHAFLRDLVMRSGA
jgi:beta-D-xylosidase 4